MARLLRSQVLTCILVLTLSCVIAAFAADVTVKNGTLYVDNSITGPAYNYPDAYFQYLYVNYYANFTSDIYVGGTAYVSYLDAYKIDCTVMDPAGVLLDQNTREGIVNDSRVTIPPDKQGGAMVFFNSETKMLEVYIPADGKFYDLQGRLLHALPAIDVATVYKTTYRLDHITGEVTVHQSVVNDRYAIREGYRLDRDTGHFMNAATGDIVPKSAAVELVKGE